MLSCISQCLRHFCFLCQRAYSCSLLYDKRRQKHKKKERRTLKKQNENMTKDNHTRKATTKEPLRNESPTREGLKPSLSITNVACSKITWDTRSSRKTRRTWKTGSMRSLSCSAHRWFVAAGGPTRHLEAKPHRFQRGLKAGERGAGRPVRYLAG